MSQLTPHAVDSDQFVKRLVPRHFQILELVLAGHDNKTIEETLGVSHSMLRMVQNSPLFQAELARRRRESGVDTLQALDRSAASAKAQSILDQAAEKAAATFDTLLESDDDSIRLRAASSILDRVFGKTGAEGSQRIVVNITADQVNLLNQALQESRSEKHPANSPAAECPEVRGSELHEESRPDGGSADLPAA